MHDLVSNMSGDCRSENANTSTRMHKGLQSRRRSSCKAQLPDLRMAHQTSFISLAFLAFVLVSFVPNDGLAFPGSIDPLTNQACLPGVINKCGTGCSRCVCCGPDVSYCCFVVKAEHEIDACVLLYLIIGTRMQCMCVNTSGMGGKGEVDGVAFPSWVSEVEMGRCAKDGRRQQPTAFPTDVE